MDKNRHNFPTSIEFEGLMERYFSGEMNEKESIDFEELVGKSPEYVNAFEMEKSFAVHRMIKNQSNTCRTKIDISEIMDEMLSESEKNYQATEFIHLDCKQQAWHRTDSLPPH